MRSATSSSEATPSARQIRPSVASRLESTGRSWPLTAPNSRAGPPDLAAWAGDLGHRQRRIDLVLHPGQFPGVSQFLQKIGQAAVRHGRIVRVERERGKRLP